MDQVIDINRNMSGDNSTAIEYFYMIQVTPGNGSFEVTIRYHGNGNYSISNDEVSRINSYANDAKCLNHGHKKYCHCT